MKVHLVRGLVAAVKILFFQRKLGGKKIEFLLKLYDRSFKKTCLKMQFQTTNMQENPDEKWNPFRFVCSFGYFHVPLSNLLQDFVKKKITRLQ